MQHKSLNPKKVFLAIIVMVNVIGSDLIACEQYKIINFDVKLQDVNERIQNTAYFHDKMNELSTLKTYVIEAQRTFPRELMKDNLKSYYEIVLLQETFEIIDFVNLEKKNCKDVLNQIHVEFDPTNGGKPRLPSPVEKVYNMIARACNLEEI